MSSNFENSVSQSLPKAFPNTRIKRHSKLAVRNLPKPQEPLYEFASSIYRQWVREQYPYGNRTHKREVDFVVQIGSTEFALEVEGNQHLNNGYRRDSFEYYPADTLLHYDVLGMIHHLGTNRRVQKGKVTGWEKSTHFQHRDQECAFRDMLADVYCHTVGKPLVRVFEWSLDRPFTPRQLRKYVEWALENPTEATALRHEFL